jgi:hypothetical protein
LLCGDGKALAVTRSKQLRFAVFPASPNRPYGVDDKSRGQLISFSKLCLADLAPAKLSTLLKKLGPCGAMDCAIDSSSAKKR